MKQPYPFHLAIPVKNLEKSKQFYENVLGCKAGRKNKNWADYNLFGNQIVLHYCQSNEKAPQHNPVDGKAVPIPHFGVVLPWKIFMNFEKRLIEKQIQFIIQPYIRFKGEVGEQKTMFFYDPSHNALEFKTFKNKKNLFES